MFFVFIIIDIQILSALGRFLEWYILDEQSCTLDWNFERFQVGTWGHSLFPNSIFVCLNQGCIISVIDTLKSGCAPMYRVSQKTWEFSDKFDIVFVMN